MCALCVYACVTTLIYVQYRSLPLMLIAMCVATESYGGGEVRALEGFFSLLFSSLLFSSLNELKLAKEVLYSLPFANSPHACALVYGLPRLLLVLLYDLSLILTSCVVEFLCAGYLFTNFHCGIFCEIRTTSALFSLSFSLPCQVLGCCLAKPALHFCNLDLVEISLGSFIQPKSN